ncbi:hypothetical protein [Niabella terrae]
MVYGLPIAIPIVLGALSLASGAASMVNSKNQADILQDEKDRMGRRKSDSQIKDMVSLAQTQLNARAPGMAQAQQGILGSQANAVGQINRNALDSSQALAMIGALQGRTNSAISGLATQDQQYKSMALQQLQQALGLKSQDDASVWADKLREYNMQAAITGTKMANNLSAVNGVLGTAGSIAGLYAQEQM